jgi:hypothetical protein
MGVEMQAGERLGPSTTSPTAALVPDVAGILSAQISASDSLVPSYTTCHPRAIVCNAQGVLRLSRAAGTVLTQMSARCLDTASARTGRTCSTGSNAYIGGATQGRWSDPFGTSVVERCSNLSMWLPAGLALAIAPAVRDSAVNMMDIGATYPHLYLAWFC